MVTLHVEIEAKGPLFQGGKAAEIVEKALDRGIEQLVQLGEQRLDLMLRPRPAGVYLSVTEAKKGQASTGHYRRSIHGVASHLHGLIHDSNVVYGPWLEGVSNRNLTTRFKGYASFRRVGQSLEKDAKKVLQGHVDKAVPELNG